MKFSKSGILTISGMLVANSFLLMATTYAASSKDIRTDPAHAEQKIGAINFIEDDQGKTCSLVVFDTSGSMGKKNGSCYDKNTKRNNAVNGAIVYSQIFLDLNDENEVGLILFGNGAYYGVTHNTACSAKSTRGQKLSRDSFDENKFGTPKENTELDKGLNKALDVFKSNQKCVKKIVVIISDGVPAGGGGDPIKRAKDSAENLKKYGVTIYSIGYGLFEGNSSNNGKGIDVLGDISGGLFFNADEGNVDDVFKKVAKLTDYNNRISTENNKLKVVSENFILESGENINGILGNSQYSSVLGGERNQISTADGSTIIAGKGNGIQISKNSSILGGEQNNIRGKNMVEELENGTKIEYYSSENSIIMGGKSNKILNGKYSSIPGGSSNIINGDYSITIGNNNQITGDHSVAMGNGTKIIGNNSFYWTDYAHRATTLKADNVFSILSHSGMVINTETPHPKAQLTISGTLIVRENVEDTTVNCGNGKGKGILKAVKKNNGETCFCTCDGKNWRSMYNGSCESLCDTKMKPVCGTKVTLECNGGKYVFSGSCNSGKVINTSYYVSNDGKKVHWTCQTYDGQTQNCSGLTPTTKPNGGNCPNPNNGGGSTCTGPRPETCPKICESPARSFGLDSPNYGNGTSNDPLVQISSYLTECNNSCGTPATETCNNVTWVNCCYESK